MIKEFKIFEKQLELFNSGEVFSLRHDDNFLYHVTNIKNLDSIKKHGILPDFGEIVRKFYSDYYDFDEPDEDESDDEQKIPIYKEIEGVSFFSETPLLGFCTPNIGMCDVKWENMVLCIIEKNDTIYHKIDDYPKFTDSDGDSVNYVGPFSVYNTPIFIETGDWFSFEEQTPKYILHGEELKKFIKDNFPKSIEKYKLTENYEYSDEKKWCHFSDVDYIKIHPQQSHADPAGIYMFPMDVIGEIKTYWKQKKYRFTCTLKPNLNILDLDSLSKQEELDIINKLESGNVPAKNAFMKYYNTDEETYYGFWQYIRDTYGYSRGFDSRNDFMKLGYDGIHSKVKIHSYEPQIIIFDPDNVIIEKVEKMEDLWDATPHIERIKKEVLRIIKEENEKYKVEEYKKFKNDCPEYLIIIKYKDKSISVKIYYTGHQEGWIYVNISPYYPRNYSLGTMISLFEPEWEDFGSELVKNLLMALSDLENERGQ